MVRGLAGTPSGGLRGWLSASHFPASSTSCALDAGSRDGRERMETRPGVARSPEFGPTGGPMNGVRSGALTVLTVSVVASV